MRRILLLGAALMLTSPLLVGQASAASAPSMNWAKAAAANDAVVEKAGYRCHRWKRKCAWRWGWGTRRYARCLWRHGC
jgi:hypothetical protein